MRRRLVILVALCMVFLAFGVSHAEPLTIGGDNGSGDLLKVEAEDDGTLYAYLWQKSTYDETYNFLQQYCGCFYSYLFLDYGTASQDLYTNNNWDDDGRHPFTLVSNDIGGEGQVVTVLGLGDADTGTGVNITQTVSYETGQLYYRKEWQISNNGDRTYTNLHFLHGGDTYFAYDDSSEGHWNDMLGMVYLTNNNMGVSGIMGMYGAISSPADHYCEGYYYSTNYESMKSGNLPDTVDSSYLDAGYSLQWNKDSLAPGDTWEIIAFEKWTEAGFVQVFAAADQVVSADVTIDYGFSIQNLQDSSDIFDLGALSSNGWAATVDPSVVSIDAFSSEAVTVSLVVPSDAVAGATDTLTLTAVSRSDDTVTNSDSVTTTVSGIPPAKDTSGGGGGCNTAALVPSALLLLAPLFLLARRR